MAARASEAERLGVTFLGEVPLQMEIRETSDLGTPIVVSKPDGPEAKIYRAIAAKVWQRLDEERGVGGSRAGDRVRVGRALGAATPAHLLVEGRKELAGELLRGRGDQPAAELGDLAADIGLRRIVEDRRCPGSPRSGVTSAPPLAKPAMPPLPSPSIV